MKSTEKQPIVITGTMIFKAVYALTLLTLIGMLIADILKIHSLDRGVMYVVVGAMFSAGSILLAQKKK